MDNDSVTNTLYAKSDFVHIGVIMNCMCEWFSSHISKGPSLFLHKDASSFVSECIYSIILYWDSSSGELFPNDLYARLKSSQVIKTEKSESSLTYGHIKSLCMILFSLI